MTATVPHPLLYDSPRTANAAATGLKHEEKQTHIFAIRMIPMSEKLRVGLFGGPNDFQLKQDMVTLGTPAFSEVGAPYTSVTLNSSQSLRFPRARLASTSGRT